MPISGDGQEPRGVEAGVSTDDTDSEELSLDLPNPSATSTTAIPSSLSAYVTVRRKKNRVDTYQPPQPSQAPR